MPPKVTLLHGGVRVTGMWLNAGGQAVKESLSLTPERSGTYNGVVYDGRAAWVTPDPQTGKWDVILPPSSVLGLYTVVLGAKRYALRVPDGVAEISFLDFAWELP